MNSATHPSAQELSAFHDRELSTDESASIEKHLSTCPACRTEIEAFSVMAELGPRIEESLPGESYWKDLPDRIVARIAAEPARKASPAPALGFWQRLWHPDGGWRLAAGATAVLAVVGGAWFVLQGQPNPLTPPSDQPVAENRTTAPGPSPGIDPAPDSESTPASMNPELFTRRVITTYGDRNNLGESLDIVPGRPVDSGISGGGIASRVSNTLPTLGPQARQFAQGVVSHGCGEDPLEQAFIAALKAEEAGDYAMASQGYRLVQANLPRGDAMHHEAEFRMQLLAWRQRLADAEKAPMDQRVRALQDLNQQAAVAFQSWQKTQRQGDCQKAWCMNKVLLKLETEVAGGDQLQLTAARIKQLKSCVE